MKTAFRQKSAHLALVILLLLACVFLACACGGTVTAELGLSGDVYPGAILSAEVDFKGDADTIATYSSKSYRLEVVSGEEIASVEEGRVRIAASAKPGDIFTLAVVIGNLRAENTFEVQEPPVRSIELICPERAEAGEEITLQTVTVPEVVEGFSPVYTLVSGEAALVGDLLTVSERADGGEIVLYAAIAGIPSAEKRIAITTVQTQEIYLTLSSETALPGSSVEVFTATVPSAVSFSTEITIEKGIGIASLNAETGVLTVSEEAELGEEIHLVARSGFVEKRAIITVDYPKAESISVTGGGTIAPGMRREFEYRLVPKDADRSKVTISIFEGEEYVEWQGGTAFTVNADAPSGAEITFLIEASEEVYRSVTYTVGNNVLTSLSIEANGSLSYLRSGEFLTFTHRAEPESYDSEVTYRATVGAELVTINGNTVTVRDGADIGRVVVVAESAEGVVSNEIEFTVAGRYSRRVYTNWTNVSLAATGENGSVWMVLPPVLNAGCLTVIVPKEVSDLVIEGRYDGTEQTAYKDLYFYFRNRAERKVTLLNFATVATQGLGGTVMDLGSAGKTEIVLKGQNLVKADSPYLLDNTGEEMDGIWDTGESYASQETLRRSGKQGYRGSAGGTAIAGYELSFRGDGTLTAYAGSGTDGTAGGKGADAIYSSGVSYYVSGAGGAGGAGGDSGSAIYAEKVDFSAGQITAVPGNAGRGGAGGAAGSLADLAGHDVTMIAGAAGNAGADGVPYPAIRAKEITGTSYVGTIGVVESLSESYNGSLANLAEMLSRYYGVDVRYGTALYNPFTSGKQRYNMEQQNDYSELMRQAQFLTYTLSQMPRNSLREVGFRSGSTLTIYLCKKITSSSGTNILGLTSDANRMWFATFNTEIRGVFYGGYFNIMLHEFVHVFHYNFSEQEKKAFEAKLSTLNYGLSYRSTASTDRVYGVTARYDETNSCFLSSYSRKTVMEDVSETISLTSLLLSLEPPLTKDTNIRKKYDLLVEAFGAEYETLNAFATKGSFFAYPHLFDEEG